MTGLLTLIIVLLAALYLLALALVLWINPNKAADFLLGFASSAFLHYLELSTRIVIGTAFVLRASLMKFSDLFSTFGWLLIGTSACLFLVPWRWHQKFAQHAVPQALRNLTLVALCSFAMGGFIMACAVFGN